MVCPKLLSLLAVAATVAVGDEPVDVDPNIADATMSALKATKDDEMRTRLGVFFDMMDVDKDMALSKEEAMQWLGSIRDRLTDYSVRMDMKNIDKDEDGFVTLTEIHGVMSDADETVMKGLKARFKLVDHDLDEQLNFDELRKLITGKDKGLVELEIKEILETHDKNGDGVISKEEFTSFEGEMSDESASRMGEEFDSLDANKDQILDTAELQKLLDGSSEEDYAESVKGLWEKLSAEDKITREDLLGKHFDDVISSVLTDDGELVRNPSTYGIEGMTDMEVPGGDINEEMKRMMQGEMGMGAGEEEGEGEAEEDSPEEPSSEEGEDAGEGDVEKEADKGEAAGAEKHEEDHDEL